jgi:hypothetical protein
MARTRTLLQMRTRVRQLTDTANDQHIADAFLTYAVNQRIADLWDILVGSDPSRFRVSTTITTTAGIRRYQVAASPPTIEDGFPADFHSMIALDLVRGTSRWPVEEYKFEERSFGDGSYSDAYGIPSVRYEIVGQGLDGTAAELRFDRDPGANTYEMHYVQAPQDLSADGDEFDGVAGWEEWAIRSVCIDVCHRQKTDPSVHMAEREKVEQRIRVYASKRDQHRPGKIQDVTRRRYSRIGWQ